MSYSAVSLYSRPVAWTWQQARDYASFFPRIVQPTGVFANMLFSARLSCRPYLPPTESLTDFSTEHSKAFSDLYPLACGCCLCEVPRTRRALRPSPLMPPLVASAAAELVRRTVQRVG